MPTARYSPGRLKRLKTRGYERTYPLTAEERRQVESCIPLVVLKATKRAGTLQAADRDDIVQAGLLQACLSRQTHRPERGALTTHLGEGAGWAALTEYQRITFRGFTGLNKMNVAQATAVLPRALPLVFSGDGERDELVTEPADHRTAVEPERRSLREFRKVYERFPELRRLDKRTRTAVLWHVVFDEHLLVVADRLGVCEERARQLVERGLKELAGPVGERLKREAA